MKYYAWYWRANTLHSKAFDSQKEALDFLMISDIAAQELTDADGKVLMTERELYQKRHPDGLPESPAD